MPGVDIAEVSAGYGNVHFVVEPQPLLQRISAPQPSPHVVDDLSRNASDIDGVHRADGVGGLESGGIVERFDKVLTIVEDAVYRNVVDIGLIQ